MKKTDIAMLILIVAVSAGLAFALVGAVPGLKLSDKGEAVQVADEYSAEVADPDTAVFNKTAINPTVEVSIGDE